MFEEMIPGDVERILDTPSPRCGASRAANGLQADRGIHPLLRRINERLQRRGRPRMPFWLAVLANKPGL
jgi:hypothetical protein